MRLLVSCVNSPIRNNVSHYLPGGFCVLCERDVKLLPCVEPFLVAAAQLYSVCGTNSRVRLGTWTPNPQSFHPHPDMTRSRDGFVAGKKGGKTAVSLAQDQMDEIVDLHEMVAEMEAVLEHMEHDLVEKLRLRTNISTCCLVW